MIPIKNALIYKHFVFIDITINNNSIKNNCFKGSICIINNNYYQLNYKDNKLYFELLDENTLEKIKNYKQQCKNIIKPNETIGVMIYENKISHYKFTIPEISQCKNIIYVE